MLSIFFIRHAQSTANVDNENSIGGRDIDVELTNYGYKQAELLGEAFSKENAKCDAAFTSYATRTQETARIVLNKINYSGWVVVEENLIEHDTGDWEGFPKSIYSREDVKEEIKEDLWNFRPGDCVKGESLSDVADRMVRVVNQIVNHYSRYSCIQNVFVFSHSVAIKALLVKWCGLSLPSTHEIQIDNTSVTVLRFKDGVWIDPLVPYEGQQGDVVRSVDGELLVSTDLWNDTSHLM
jgi:broad specificity phosphatase PhoE